jgi:hypothetical protein
VIGGIDGGIDGGIEGVIEGVIDPGDNSTHRRRRLGLGAGQKSETSGMVETEEGCSP